jgi:hypothetical protein
MQDMSLVTVKFYTNFAIQRGPSQWCVGMHLAIEIIGFVLSYTIPNLSPQHLASIMVPIYIYINIYMYNNCGSPPKNANVIKYYSFRVGTLTFLFFLVVVLSQQPTIMNQ